MCYGLIQRPRLSFTAFGPSFAWGKKKQTKTTTTTTTKTPKKPQNIIIMIWLFSLLHNVLLSSLVVCSFDSLTGFWLWMNEFHVKYPVRFLFLPAWTSVHACRKPGPYSYRQLHTKGLEGGWDLADNLHNRYLTTFKSKWKWKSSEQFGGIFYADRKTCESCFFLGFLNQAFYAVMTLQEWTKYSLSLYTPVFCSVVIPSCGHFRFGILLIYKCFV